MDGVTVVICCHNSAGRLPATLAHLRGQAAAKFPWEVVVVDNASRDRTAEVARLSWECPVPLRVVSEPTAGLVHARLRGLKEARYEYISFVDDDNWVAPDWVSGVRRMFEAHPEAGALNGYNEASVESELPAWFERFTIAYAVTPKDWIEGDVTDTRGWLWGAGLSIRKTAWDQIAGAGWRWRLTGRKGKALSCGEDSELAIALRLAGWRLRYEPALRLKHRLDSHRLNWPYLRRMMRAMGEASVFHDLYLPAGRPWWRLALSSMKTALGASLAGVALLASPGNWRVLSMDRELGRLAALWRLRPEYSRLKSEVQATSVKLQTLRPGALVAHRSAPGL